MNKKMEEIIAKDLGISVKSIRNSSWKNLEKRRRKVGEKAFRPEGMFSVDGNINLSLKREMGMNKIAISEMNRKVTYKIKHLLKFKQRT